MRAAKKRNAAYKRKGKVSVKHARLLAKTLSKKVKKSSKLNARDERRT